MENICQSCAMPLDNDEQSGTNEDGSSNSEYCCFCYKDGKFTSEVNLDEFIEKQVKIGQEKMNLSENQARDMAEKILPGLRRWKK